VRRKYLAFDIETAKILPRDTPDILARRPLGICCGAALASDKRVPQFFCLKDAGGVPSAKMRKDDLSGLVDFLTEQTQNGYTILTHNGLRFDFDVLAEESGRLQDCRRLAVAHVDIMFHVFCCKGFGVSLEAAGKAIGLKKSDEIKGWQAPQLWKNGEYETVLKYVGQDCRIALEVAEKSERQNSFSWIKRSGEPGDLALPTGWLTVEDAMRLPMPPDPLWPRSKFTKWLG
jgi:hypothetical protein